MDEQQDPDAGSMLRTLKSRYCLVDDDDALRSYLTRRFNSMIVLLMKQLMWSRQEITS